ncbi:MAG: translation elongation factor Ts, partial [Oscillospiraceae bacterium]|nr:translation elongation factor Ts [Oscillospiraceae bacterium]
MMFTASDVKNLRELTGVGMMDCKRALTESEGDVDKAIAWLREKGLATAQKKAGRIAAEGVVAVKTGGSVAAIVEVNIETDFAAKNELFHTFASDLADLVASENPADLDALLKLTYPGETKTVADVLIDRVQVIGENIRIRRFERYDSGLNLGYVHFNKRIGVVVQLEVSGGIADKPEVAELGKDLAIQIAAMRPLYLDNSVITPEAMEAEREVQYNKALEENREKKLDEDKAKQVAEKMVAGRMNKFFEEVCLMNQEYAKSDEKITCAKHVANVAKQVGGEIKVVKFVRFEAGEGIEKKEN